MELERERSENRREDEKERQKRRRRGKRKTKEKEKRKRKTEVKEYTREKQKRKQKTITRSQKFAGRQMTSARLEMQKVLYELSLFRHSRIFSASFTSMPGDPEIIPGLQGKNRAGPFGRNIALRYLRCSRDPRTIRYPFLYDTGTL